MRRYISLALEGIVLGALLGTSISLINRNFQTTVLISMLIGAILRILIDYIWKVYNQLTGKSLD